LQTILSWIKQGTHTMSANLPAVALVLEVNRE